MKKSDLWRSGLQKQPKQHWLNNVLSQLRISCIFRIKLLSAPKIFFEKYFSRCASAPRSKNITSHSRPIQTRTEPAATGTFYERHFAGERKTQLCENVSMFTKIAKVNKISSFPQKCTFPPPSLRCLQTLSFIKSFGCNFRLKCILM